MHNWQPALSWTSKHEYCQHGWIYQQHHLTTAVDQQVAFAGCATVLPCMHTGRPLQTTYQHQQQLLELGTNLQACLTMLLLRS